jgi:hypothetical protein
MQLKDAESLRRSWGDKPCNHDHVDREYYNDMQTGDMVCIACGQVIYDAREWPAYRAETGPKFHDLGGK